jgi:hypothetical protein
VFEANLKEKFDHGNASLADGNRWNSINFLQVSVNI